MDMLHIIVAYGNLFGLFKKYANVYLIATAG